MKYVWLLNLRHLYAVLGVKVGSLWFASLRNITLPLCRSALQLTKSKCLVGPTGFVPTQCDLELEKEQHSNFLVALVLRNAKASLQQTCKARMLPGAFVITGRQLVSRPYSQLTCAGSLLLNCRGVLCT